MAGIEPSQDGPVVPIQSTETALCIIPPAHLWGPLDRLRFLYDKAYGKWPPHVNLIYPFVEPESLARASDLIASHLGSRRPSAVDTPVPITLDSADFFSHRHGNTVFLRDSESDDQHTCKLMTLRQQVLEALRQSATSYRMHMTIGQSNNIESDTHQNLLHKVSLMPNISWHCDEVSILVRERSQLGGSSSSQMKLWGTISLKDYSVSRKAEPLPFYGKHQLLSSKGEDCDEDYTIQENSQDRSCWHFSSKLKRWEPVLSAASSEEDSSSPASFRVSSYNVLAEFSHPPSQTRYPFLLQTLLEKSAVADAVVLQEVTDDFLCYILRNEAIREVYPYASHGPPDQEDLEPLPSHLNIVVLSKWAFTWRWTPFNQKHKGSVVVQFNQVGTRQGALFLPVILAAVHLTCGLSDRSVSAKKDELRALLRYLGDRYSSHPWILAGDFNITTSLYTIEAALERKSISKETAKQITNLEVMLAESGLSDSWLLARLGNVGTAPETERHDKDAFEGEQGATFDPISNELASAAVGSGFNHRPQRYDRILVKDAGLLSVSHFDVFGQRKYLAPEENVASGPRTADTEDKRKSTYASDHWGIRCSLRLSDPEAPSDETEKHSVPVKPIPAPDNLSETSVLRQCLTDLRVSPSELEADEREEALQLLRNTILETDATTQNQNRSSPRLVIVPVGSYGLGVWTSSSDIDCLCIGPISSRTFFTLATQRLRKAASQGIRVLRRVNANSGTMLELEVRGIRMDLQYCPSALIAETWPRAMYMPASSQIFALSTQTLAKLKPVRDLFYLRRTLPDFAAFRTALYLIKTWAKRRGLYSARFGYLGGIHIAILLARICKFLSTSAGHNTVPTILTTFFDHYSHFDWENQMVFDPFFHKRLRYVRTSREPMAILGYHPPALNTAHTASKPSVRTISEEFRSANQLLSTPDMTWSKFLGGVQSDSGAQSFLGAYKSFVKIDAQFWGISLAKGSQYVGWLESRCVMLLVDLNRRLPDIHVRIWPARFVDQEHSAEEKDYQGYYLIGLDRWESRSDETLSKGDVKTAFGTLQTVLQRFEGQIRGDEKYFDSTTMWMSTSVVNKSDLGTLRLDTREWGEYTLGDDESEDEQEEDEQDEQEDMDGFEKDDFTEAAARMLRKPREGVAGRPLYDGKFRSSADVMNRIRWDPDMDSGDYIVGYRDRFLGLMERPLDQWKSEQTDEEFIPQHRILYFKLRSDASLVWDRKARRDKIFGSGIKDDAAVA